MATSYTIAHTWKPPQMSFNGWMDKQYDHIIDYCSVIKRNDTHKNRDTAPHSADCMLYGFIYNKLAKGNYRQKGVWACRRSNTK